MVQSKLPFDYRQSAGIYLSSLTKTTGNINVHEDIVVDGLFQGQIQTTGLCEVSENGIVTGDIQARMITILGSIDGSCKAKETIDVKKSAKAKGYLIAPSVGIEAGAEVDVRCKQPSMKGLENE